MVREQVQEAIPEEEHGKDEIEESYEDHVEDTEITDRQDKTIAERRDVLVDILDDELAIRDSQLIGSYTRGTMVGPLDEDSDADVMIVLDPDEHREWINQNNGPKNALRAIKRKIENDPRFSDTEVAIDRNVVQVKYHDSTIEIAPAFPYTAVPHAESPSRLPWKDTDDGYAIPDTHGKQTWMGTNPRAYKQQFQARNEANNGKVAGLTRTMKNWAEKNDVPVRSYHMEVMVYNYYEEKAESGDPVPETYEELTQDFIETLPQRVRESTTEPIYEERVDEGMTREEKNRASTKAQQAREKLREARRLKEQGEDEEAKEKLREVHGDDF